MYPESGVGLVGLGIVLLHQKEAIMAKALLHKGKQECHQMTLTWGSLVCLVIVSRRDLYERRQTSKIKTTVLQCYVGSSLVVHYCRL